MSEQTSRLVFFAQGRRRRLYRKTPMGPFYVRFQYAGRDIPRCLETTEPQVAILKAKHLIKLAYEEDEVALRDAKVRSDYSSLYEICEVYRGKYGTTAKRKRSAQTNIGALQAMVRASGINFADARANVLAGALIRRFEEDQEKRIERDPAGNMVQASELRVRSYIYSRTKQAKAIFKKAWMNWYEKLVLPDLTSFREQGVTAPDRPKPRRLDEGVMEAIEADVPRLAREQPAVYATFLLFSQLGLRNGEIKFARRNWIVKRADGSGEIEIINRPEENFKPKAKTEGMVPIAREVLDELLRLAEPEEKGGFLVPAANKTEREKIVDRQHSAWCGQWIKQRSKVSYELRRFAGSRYYQQTGDLGKVQKFLRHADLKTTMDWYWYLLDRLEPMEAPAWLGKPQLAVVA